MPSATYAAARRALAQHLFRHHDRSWARGTLSQRLDQHDTAHWEAAARGAPLAHRHAPLGEQETLEQVAHRYLTEGTHG